MGKKLQRVFRDRRLTPEEAAADNEIRQRLNAEYPPTRSSSRAQSSSLSELLKKSIRESNKSIDEIAREAGISPSLIAHFLSGDRDIHLATADKLANSLGLEVATE
jgi:transcriptional regulator with XRE-family HTH domain